MKRQILKTELSYFSRASKVAIEGSRAAAMLLDEASGGEVRRPLGARLRNIRAILSVCAPGLQGHCAFDFLWMCVISP